MTDSYYELLAGDGSADDPLGEKFCATDLVRSTWSAALQHAAPVSALLVRALERCAARDDTRLSRVAIDLLGPVPAEGDLWIRSHVERPGKQIELISAEMLALGPDGQPRPTARASGWRLQQLDTTDLAHAATPLPRPVSEGRSRNLEKDWDRNYVHSLDWRWLTQPLNDGPGESWIKPTVNLVNGETMTPLERLFAVADCANGIGSKLDITKWTFLNNDLVVHVHRIPDGDWIGIRAETNYGPDGIGTTVGTLFDQTGAVGSIQQSVLVRPRPSRPKR
ncbi:thioesterase family protein [Mycobacterium sp.]|uniref:thioesterase family protein n=1 Tax=Mycobacterium sp. TaxID=1785 RepID=UPI003C76337D